MSPLPPLLLLLLLAHLSTTAGIQQASEPVKTLHVGQQLTGELVKLDSEVRRYSLEGLKPDTGYEVRISYPASIPANIKLQLVEGDASDAHTQARRFSRRLLDCDKLVFATDSTGAANGVASAQVLLQAQRASVHRDGPTAGPQYLIYNILVAELWLGLPVDTLPVAAVVLVVILAVAAFTPLWTRRVFPQLLDWVAPPGSNSSNSSTAVGDTSASKRAS